MNGRQPGDPARAADALVRVADMDEPPRRLPLGSMAIEHLRRGLRARLDDVERCTQIAAAADYPRSGISGAREELVRRAYAAFNRRAVDEALELLSPDVDWPNVPDGGFVHGHEQVRRHWREQFGQADPQIEIDDVAEVRPGCVEARVRQIVRDRDGRTVADDRWLHVFTIADERIRRLDVRAAVPT